MKICPFEDVPFKEIPGYEEGSGCPLCKGLAFHIGLPDTIADSTLTAAFLKLYKIGQNEMNTRIQELEDLVKQQATTIDEKQEWIDRLSVNNSDQLDIRHGLEARIRELKRPLEELAALEYLDNLPLRAKLDDLTIRARKLLGLRRAH
jgi:hypothetical protein